MTLVTLLIFHMRNGKELFHGWCLGMLNILMIYEEVKYMAKRREIKNSTAEFLIFQIKGKERGVEVYYKDKTVWRTQKTTTMNR